MNMSAFIIDFALSNSCWYNAFHIHVDLHDASLCSGLHTSAVPGENIKLNKKN